MASFIYDTECYPNFWMALFKNIETGEVIRFQQSPSVKLSMILLQDIMESNLTVGFNSLKYDVPMIQLAIRGADCAELYRASNDLIVGGMKSKEFHNEYGTKKHKFNTIDLIEVAPLAASLKIYGGRLHCTKMQSLPIDPHTMINRETANLLYQYCINDLEITELLYKELEQQIKLRETMSAEYGQDLRSKSDAQIAEAVIVAEVEKVTGKHIQKPIVEPGTSYKYKVPSYISYNHPQLKAMLTKVKNTKFVVDDEGSIGMPPELKKLTVNINGSSYRLGLGGVHSSETCVKHVSDGEYVLIDADVSSYYPSIILNLGLYPKHMGPVFLVVYKSLVDRRLAAKKAGNKVVADSLKITINGIFGSFGCKYKKVHSPDLLIQTTITGQLALLMLIERIEDAGIEIVSANTDGTLIKCPQSRQDELGCIISEWERLTSFLIDQGRYRAFYGRDVNNYIAIKDKGAKTKGAYAIGGLSKNPQNTICVKAVIELLTNGTPLAETIRASKDIRDFVTVRKVTEGAEYDGKDLGKSIRFYYGTISTGCMIVGTSKVPGTDGAVPLMQLPSEFPTDIDYLRYEIMAQTILNDIGYSQLGLFA